MKRRTLIAFVALVLIAFGTAFAKTTTSKQEKQTGGGSTGDSLTNLPDTSDAYKIQRGTSSWYVTCAADSQCRYTIQTSHGGTYWHTLQAIDSTSAAGAAKTTSAFNIADIWMRVILDPVPDASSPFGASYIHEVK